LQELGWRDGSYIRLDVRWGAADMDRMRTYVGEFLGLRPDAILATSGRVVRVLQRETRELPIVFVGPVDPVGSGLVESIAQPGGNITGFTTAETSFAGKWLEMLKEMAPQIARVAFIFSPDNPSAAGNRSLLENIAPSFGTKLIPAAVRTAADIESAVHTFTREPNGGLILPLDETVSVHRELLASLTRQYSIPAISGYPAFVAAGGLMSYGPDLPNIYLRAASYVDRILHGERPGDLPVQQPTKYQLVINLKAAKALGLAVPITLQVAADEIIE
jgi:putative ABC transport system substrate-binding protein